MTGQSYHYTAHPEVRGLSFKTSGLNGGATLAISGTGFDSAEGRSAILRSFRVVEGLHRTAVARLAQLAAPTLAVLLFVACAVRGRNRLLVGNNVVLVAGSPCAVTYSDLNTILCKLGAGVELRAPVIGNVTQSVFAGGRGLYWEVRPLMSLLVRGSFVVPGRS